MAGLGPEAAGDGDWKVGRLRGCEAHPHALAAWAEVAHGLLATEAGGCGRGHRWQTSTGSGGPRGKGSASIGGARFN
jgi:hypothetical protein